MSDAVDQKDTMEPHYLLLWLCIQRLHADHKGGLTGGLFDDNAMAACVFRRSPFDDKHVLSFVCSSYGVPPPPAIRSQIVFEVKPWDTETDLKGLFAKICNVSLASFFFFYFRPRCGFLCTVGSRGTTKRLREKQWQNVPVFIRLRFWAPNVRTVSRLACRATS